MKVLRPGYGNRGLADRFRVERQILARLDHPNIARLLDGGTTATDVPYLVMELVDGAPIDQFCRTRALSIAARLRLFLHVCSAVQFAHQRLVIHRDIKPGNILVTGDGTPKLLDFGIAKLLDPIGEVEETSRRPFTPGYASPEQILGDRVSTATDVYALGVVLYELLTGCSPYSVESRTATALADAITSREPERPSTAVRRAATIDPTASPLPPQLDGDLDCILLKALRKEPEKRYASVEQFAEDIRRHLDGRPVAARKGTWTYRSVKFARRHRHAVAAATLVVLSLVATIAVTAREARIAETNRRRADARFNDVRGLANSLIFEVHQSIKDLPGSTDARKLILQRALGYLDSLAKESGNEPDLVRELAAAYDRIAVLQRNQFKVDLGDTKSAQVSYERSVALHESLARSSPRRAADQVGLAAAYLAYAEFQFGDGNLAVGFDFAKRALAILDRETAAAPDDERSGTLLDSCLETLGMMQAGNGLMGTVGTPRQGVAHLQRALERRHHALARSPSDDTLRYRQGVLEIVIGEALMQLGDRPAALVQFQQALADETPLARRQDNASAARNLAATYGKIGDLLLIDGKASEALPYYGEFERVASRLAAADADSAQLQLSADIALVELGHALVELDRTDEGLPYIRRAVERMESDQTDLPFARSIEALVRGWFGEALERQGKVREAAHEYAVVKERIGAIRGSGENTRVLGYLAMATDRHAAALVKLRRADDAAREYQETLDLLEPLVKTHPNDYELVYVLADTYTAQAAMSAARAERARTRPDRLAAWQSAAAWNRKSLDVWRTVPHPARISTAGFEVTLPDEVANRLARCERELSALRESGS
jgi:eukaryotic-like serine/threonine-protein kinase